jgi:NAD(P)-dependent dehydrogenase (short-subunit alcohol dehydrogenase family)
MNTPNVTAGPRVALVTGAGAGMGRATSLRLARLGYPVGCLDIDYSAAEAVTREIIEAGGTALTVTADIASKFDIEWALDQVRGKLGPVAILINNAAVEHFGRIDEIDDASWDRVIGVNLKGTFALTQAVVPGMIGQGWGRIVNLAAIGAQTGAPDMSLYTATKGAVIAMTRSLAVELGRHGITVNAVSPGFIDTPMARRAIDGDLFPVPYEQIVAGYPIPRLGRPEEVASACAFFASEDAGYVTGQLLGVNGGAAV